MRKNGFTLIELLIVVAIIGIIVAIAIPNLLAAVQRARQKRTMADMKTISTVWEAYFVDYAYYYPGGGCTQLDGITLPATAVSIPAMIAELQPTYISKLPQLDGWNRSWYFYLDVDTGAQSYKLESLGKDGIADNYCGLTRSFNNDLVLSDDGAVCSRDECSGSAYLR